MPLCGEKKPTGPINQIGVFDGRDAIYLIHLIHLSPKPICLRMLSKYDQLTFSKTFSMFSLNSNPGSPLFTLQSSVPLA